MFKTLWALERGAGTVLALGLIATFSLLICLAANLASVVVSKVRLDAAADSAALAGADALRGLVASFPCDAAREVSALVSSCSIVDGDVLVVLRDGPIMAKARAGAP